MSGFRKASELRAAKTYSLTVWGPHGSGKSTFAASAPEPAFLDFENRAIELVDKFDISAVTPTSNKDTLKWIAEVASGRVPCKTIVADSFSKPYQALVNRFTVTTRNDAGKESATTDWVAVNRLMLEVTDPFWAVPDRNRIAIARQQVRLQRQGRDFTRDGVKMIGDQARWEYDPGYVLHFAARGSIEVMKSMSDFIPLGTQIRGDLDFARFVRLAEGLEAIDAVKVLAKTTLPPLRAAEAKPAVSTPIADPIEAEVNHRERGGAKYDIEALLINLDESQTRAVCALAKAMKADDARLAVLIGSLTGAINAPLDPADIDKLKDLLKAQKAA